MSSQAISAENLSKRYRIGELAHAPDTLVGTIKSWAQSPFRNLNYLRELGQASGGTDTDSVLALRDVSFAVEHGEVIGIVGRNGAGKSTLLKILARITDPSSGYARIRGRISSLLEVGTGFHPELSGRENVYMNGTILGMSKAEIDRKFDQIVEFSGVEKFLDTPTKRYSSGMQVRLAFSVAAHLEPEILIIDEVLAVGDAEFQRRCIGKMQDVATDGRTVLFVSHNTAAIEQLCTSAMLLSAGQVAATGPVPQVMKTYMQDLFTTQSEVGDDAFRVSFTSSIEGQPSETPWLFDSTLNIEVEVWSKEAIEHPAVDVYFHSSAGRMIFAQSDQLSTGANPERAHRWKCKFSFKNNGFVSDYMTVDVGFRYSSSTRYLAMWRSLAAIALGPLPNGFTRGRDCPIAVPCSVELTKVAA